MVSTAAPATQGKLENETQSPLSQTSEQAGRLRFSKPLVEPGTLQVENHGCCEMPRNPGLLHLLPSYLLMVCASPEDQSG